jgi:hypothetical protein
VMYPDRSVSTERNDDQILRIRASKSRQIGHAVAVMQQQKCMHSTYCGSTPFAEAVNLGGGVRVTISGCEDSFATCQ